MTTYFSKFPIINYANNNVIDITKRAKILDLVYNNPYTYYMYDVKEYERPDNIASKYYNDPYYDWSIWLSNKIIDPYHQWYLDQESFHSLMKEKYGSIEIAQLKIKYYRNNWYNNTDPISVSAFNALTADQQQYYQPDFGLDLYNTTPLQYNRRREDLVVSTNLIVQYSCNGSSFSTDELIVIDYDGSSSNGYGQIITANSTTVKMQHIQNYQAIANGNLVSRESTNATAISFANQTLLANNIPTPEYSYWSPVTYYEYENEINENNKSIKMLNKNYIYKLNDEMKRVFE